MFLTQNVKLSPGFISLRCFMELSVVLENDNHSPQSFVMGKRVEKRCWNMIQKFTLFDPWMKQGLTDSEQIKNKKIIVFLT